MTNEKSSTPAQSALLFLFLMGAGARLGSGRPGYLCILLGSAAAAVLYPLFPRLMRARIFKLAVSPLALWSAANTLLLLLRFGKQTALDQSPTAVLAALLAFLVLCTVRSGKAALFRIAKPLAGLILILLTFSMAAGIPDADFAAILPVRLPDGWLADTAETAAQFLGGFFAVSALGASNKAAYPALATSTLMLSLLSVHNIVLLGKTVARFGFPTYTSSSIATLGRFFSRIELFVSASLLLCALMHASLCILFVLDAMRKKAPTPPQAEALPKSF